MVSTDQPQVLFYTTMTTKAISADLPGTSRLVTVWVMLFARFKPWFVRRSKRNVCIARGPGATEAPKLKVAMVSRHWHVHEAKARWFFLFWGVLVKVPSRDPLKTQRDVEWSSKIIPRTHSMRWWRGSADVLGVERSLGVIFQAFPDVLQQSWQPVEDGMSTRLNVATNRSYFFHISFASMIVGETTFSKTTAFVFFTLSLRGSSSFRFHVKSRSWMVLNYIKILLVFWRVIPSNVPFWSANP